MDLGKINVEIISIRDADDEELQRISDDGMLSLNLAEMQAIRDYFAGIDRDPTAVAVSAIV